MISISPDALAIIRNKGGVMTMALTPSLKASRRLRVMRPVPSPGPSGAHAPGGRAGAPRLAARPFDTGKLASLG